MDPRPSRQLKRRLALFNRPLAWTFVSLTMIGIPLASAVEGGVDLPAWTPWLVAVFNVAFVAFIALHTTIAIYVFGLPRPRRTWRTAFIYLGYANLILGLLALVWPRPFYFVFIQSMIAHVAIGARAALKRIQPPPPQPTK